MTVGIDWGDGSAVQNVAVTGDADVGWTLAPTTHLYAAGGNFTITVDGLDNGLDTEVVTLPNTPVVLGVTSGGDAGSVTTLTLPRPAEAVNGSILYAFLRAQVLAAVDFTSPAWTRVGPDFVPSDLQRGIGWYMHPIIDITKEPTSYTFTRAPTGGRVAGGILAVSGGALVTGQNPTYSGTGGNTGIPQTRDTAAYPVKVIHGLQLFGCASEHVSPNADAPVAKPVGFTDRVYYVTPGGTAVSRTSLYVGSRETATPSSAASYSTAGQSMAAESIAVSPPSRSQMFDSVTDMLATPGFTWAHRGNSHYFAEESAYAYAQAVARGYAVLELSLNRTSDGAWIACHDRDLNRTSGLAAGTLPNISAMTWDQVQTYQNTISVDGVDQPYARAGDLLDTFGPSGVLWVIDPKYAWIDSMAYRDEFWTLCASFGGPTKVIPKYFIDATNLATEAASRGYKPWGYAYAANLADANFPTWAAAPWTMLGMEISATQPQWDSIKSYGKPVIGHIDLTLADYTTAITKGAAGVQVGSSEIIKPVNGL